MSYLRELFRWFQEQVLGVDEESWKSGACAPVLKMVIPSTAAHNSGSENNSPGNHQPSPLEKGDVVFIQLVRKNGNAGNEASQYEPGVFLRRSGDRLYADDPAGDPFYVSDVFQGQSFRAYKFRRVSDDCPITFESQAPPKNHYHSNSNSVSVNSDGSQYKDGSPGSCVITDIHNRASWVSSHDHTGEIRGYVPLFIHHIGTFRPWWPGYAKDQRYAKNERKGEEMEQGEETDVIKSGHEDAKNQKYTESQDHVENQDHAENQDNVENQHHTENQNGQNQNEENNKRLIGGLGDWTVSLLDMNNTSSSSNTENGVQMVWNGGNESQWVFHRTGDKHTPSFFPDKPLPVFYSHWTLVTIRHDESETYWKHEEPGTRVRSVADESNLDQNSVFLMVDYSSAYGGRRWELKSRNNENHLAWNNAQSHMSLYSGGAPMPLLFGSNAGSLFGVSTVLEASSGGLEEGGPFVDRDAFGNLFSNHGLSADTAPTFTVDVVSCFPSPTPSRPRNVHAEEDPQLEGIVQVLFEPPLLEGDGPALEYVVTSTPDDITATGTSSPILVEGLRTNVSYTFTVRYDNMIGEGTESKPSNSVVL